MRVFFTSSTGPLKIHIADEREKGRERDLRGRE